MRKLINVTLLVMVVCVLVSCGEFISSNKQTDDVNESFNTYEVKNESQDIDKEQNRSESEDIVRIIRDAQPFSDGLAWIKLENEENWKCINEEGNVLFEKECVFVDEFINGYAVIDFSIVIDSSGNDLYDFGSEGYKLIDSQPLDVGCIILEKDIDTYEKSGTFLYVLDVDEKKITEIDFSDCAYYTASKKWGDFYRGGEGIRESNVGLCDYLGKGYYTLKLDDADYSSNFKMIQWYDVKNNSYINIDSGNEYDDEDLPDSTIYYKTSNPNIYCVYITVKNRIYYINIDTCSIENVINGYIDCIGYYQNLVDVFPEDYLLKCYDDRDDKLGWFLDMNSREKIILQPEFENYEIVSYNGEYFCVSLINDIGTHYLAVVNKMGETVYSPVEYDFDSKFKPCFWGNNFIFYNGEEMCFVNTTSWTIENQVMMDLYNDNNIRENMCLMDSNSPEIKYFVHFGNGFDNGYSYYLSNGSEVAVGTKKYPTVIVPGIFESKLLIWDDAEQCNQFLNSDLTPFQIKVE